MNTEPYRPRVVVVTGATSGFGEACARRFVAAGCRTILAARRTGRLLELKKELGDLAFALTLDVRDDTAVKRAAAALSGEWASVDLLVNNAGLALGLEPAHRADPAEWEQMIDTNIKGLVHCTRAFLPGMVERGRGHIVNMGSIAGDYSYPGGNVYGATKAFVMRFSLNLRADLVATKVRVTNIEPGLAETEFSLVRFHGDAERAKKVYDGTTPMSADDVADAVFWAATRPPHLNINRIELMPACQAAGPLAIHRE